MKMKVTKINLPNKLATKPKIGVTVYFEEEVEYAAHSCSVTVYLENKDYTISELEMEAIKTAREFLKTV